MKKNKFAFVFICAITLLGAAFVSCSKNSSAKSDKIKIVTTIFPEYDWVREILGENKSQVELTLLLDNGVDLHSYQPSVQDIAKISSADLFIYVGGESDGWVEDVLRTAHNKKLRSLNLLEALGENAKEEEIIEGMECELEEDEHDEHGHEHEEAEYDEHVWLSLRNAKFFSGKITDLLCQMDSSNEKSYRENFEAYAKKLEALDSAYASAVNESEKKTLLFGDRFPFRYFTEDYGINYYAAFVGCSAETEASFKTIAFLSQKLDEYQLNYVIKIEGSEDKIARTIIQNSTQKNAQVLTLDSIQSVTAKDKNAGATYISIMEKNLDVIKTALK